MSGLVNERERPSGWTIVRENEWEKIFTYAKIIERVRHRIKNNRDALCEHWVWICWHTQIIALSADFFYHRQNTPLN